MSDHLRGGNVATKPGGGNLLSFLICYYRNHLFK